ncbi:c-type cytochrome [Sphingomonas sp.]|uniref:c-type cytochrome n=1 Tax=Sphingomonas sp. TaxID=28214 RepID=UPI003B00C8D6
MRRAIVLLPLTLAACDLSMKQQAKHEAQSAATYWPGGAPVSAPPEGTIARDAPARAIAAVTRPALTPALLERGRQRYNVDCAMCHGPGGAGDGSIVRRGFPAPAPFQSPGQRVLPPEHVVEVIAHGWGTMYGHADRVEPADRWAIAAYVQALGRVAPGAAG